MLAKIFMRIGVQLQLIEVGEIFESRKCAPIKLSTDKSLLLQELLNLKVTCIFLRHFEGGHMKAAATAWWDEVKLMFTTTNFSNYARTAGMIGHFTQVSFIFKK